MSTPTTNRNEIVRDVIHSLSSAMVYSELNNEDTNRKLWDEYARSWSKDAPWVIKMNQDKESNSVKILGDEWSHEADLKRVVKEFILPYINLEDDAVVGEIGSGGGRVASNVVPILSAASHFVCFDISIEMLKKARETLSCASNVEYCLVKQCSYSPKQWERFDFLYCFDVFVHMDLHTIWKTLCAMKKMLKCSGRAFISTSNLCSPGGWNRFEKQENYTVGGFYFVTPEIIDLLVAKSGFRIVKKGEYDASNTYLHRDYLLVLEKIKQD